jgi:RHS repeat-associated protein
MTAGEDVSNIGYTGHEWNYQIDLFMTQYRAYDPALGRWLNEDPIGYHDGLNLYAYVRNSPVVWRDPLGLAAGGIGASVGAPPLPY